MSDQFLFDVFLSHSSKDKAVVRPLAERLRAKIAEWKCYERHIAGHPASA